MQAEAAARAAAAGNAKGPAGFGGTAQGPAGGGPPPPIAANGLKSTLGG